MYRGDRLGTRHRARDPVAPAAGVPWLPVNGISFPKNTVSAVQSPYNKVLDVFTNPPCFPVNVFGIFADRFRVFVNVPCVFTDSLRVLVNVPSIFTELLDVLVSALLYRRLSETLASS
jgi:hypothetical protein